MIISDNNNSEKNESTAETSDSGEDFDSLACELSDNVSETTTVCKDRPPSPFAMPDTLLPPPIIFSNFDDEDLEVGEDALVELEKFIERQEKTIKTLESHVSDYNAVSSSTDVTRARSQKQMEKSVNLTRIHRPRGTRFPESEFYNQMGLKTAEIQNNLPSLVCNSNEALKFWEEAESTIKYWIKDVCKKKVPMLQPYIESLQTRWIFVFICHCFINFSDLEHFGIWKETKEHLDRISQELFACSAAFYEIESFDDIFETVFDEIIESDFTNEAIAVLLLEMWIGMIEDKYEKFVNVKLTGKVYRDFLYKRDVWFLLNAICKIIMNNQIGMPTITVICSYLKNGPIISRNAQNNGSTLRQLLLKGL